MPGAAGGILGDHLPGCDGVRVLLGNLDREALFLEFPAGLVGVGSLVVLYGDGLAALADNQVDFGAGGQKIPRRCAGGDHQAGLDGLRPVLLHLPDCQIRRFDGGAGPGEFLPHHFRHRVALGTFGNGHRDLRAPEGPGVSGRVGADHRTHRDVLGERLLGGVFEAVGLEGLERLLLGDVGHLGGGGEPSLGPPPGDGDDDRRDHQHQDEQHDAPAAPVDRVLGELGEDRCAVGARGAVPSGAGKRGPGRFSRGGCRPGRGSGPRRGRRGR